MNNKPVHSPLTSPQRILDVGCGTGAMTVILARLFPQAEVIGVDIAPVPSNRHGPVPSNITYIQGDIRQLIASGNPNFQPASFDYVFERLLIMAITDWPAHISAISNLVRPGGWLECHEFSWTMFSSAGEDRPFGSSTFFNAMREDTKAIGVNIDVGEGLAGTFRSVGGLGEVREVIYECRPREQAERPELRALEGQIRGLFKFILEKICTGRRSQEEIAKLNEEVDETWESKLDGTERHRMFVVFGRKD